MFIKIKTIPVLLLFSYDLILSYALYYANLHSHTSYSDGQSIPRHAFAYARDTARIDVLAVTDHGEHLVSSEWEDIKEQADSATIPGRFLGLAGFEWTSPIYGHLNIFNTDDYTNSNLNPTMDLIYNWMINRDNAIGQFNHPAVNNYNSFAYSSVGDVPMTLFEMQNKEQAKRYYIPLDSGWHIGITANQDNHSANWGMGNRLTGIWADSLTKSSIILALQNMRTFGTLDRNFRLEFRANGSWMGSTILNGEIRFEISCLDPDSLDFIRRLDIITNNNTILDSLILGNTNRIEWQTTTFTNNNERRYFFVRVIENDSDYILSSAIWTEEGVAIDDLGSIALWKNPYGLGNYKISPNPFTSSIMFLFKPSFLRDLEAIKIYTPGGKLVKTLILRHQGPVTRNSAPVFWDGKDKVGKEVPAGVYFVNFENRSKRFFGKILRVSQ